MSVKVASTCWILISVDKAGWMGVWAGTVYINLWLYKKWFPKREKAHPQEKAHFWVWICISYTNLLLNIEPTLVCGLWRPLSSSPACAFRTIDIRRKIAPNQATPVCKDGVCSSVEGHDIPGWGGISDIILDIYKDAELTWPCLLCWRPVIGLLGLQGFWARVSATAALPRLGSLNWPKLGVLGSELWPLQSL